MMRTDIRMLAAEPPSVLDAVVVRIVGASVYMPEFPELDEYVLPTDFDGQYLLAFSGNEPVTTPDKGSARRFNGAEGALTVLPLLRNLLTVLEPADPC